MNEPGYTIVGSDGKQYGPVTAAQIRDWLRQARVDSRTPVFVAGAADWTFVGLLPEFTAYFPGNPPTITAPTTVPVKNNSLATWGFICGLLAWTLCGCCLPFAIVGLALSIIALVQINASAAPVDGRGLAIAGVVLSASNLVWSFGWMVLSFLNDSASGQWHLGN